MWLLDQLARLLKSCEGCDLASRRDTAVILPAGRHGHVPPGVRLTGRRLLVHPVTKATLDAALRPG
jgi:hypothetical protein